MIEPANIAPDAEAGANHEHEWRLVSEETDGHVTVRESLCTGCGAILIEE